MSCDGLDCYPISFSNCKQIKSAIFYLNGEKMIFTYDFLWQRTLFVLYTLLPD